MKISKKTGRKKSAELSVHPINEELREKITKVGDEAKKAASRAQKIARDTQSVADNADAMLPLVPYIKPQHVEGLMNNWHGIYNSMLGINGLLRDTDDSTGGTLSITSTATVKVSGTFLNDDLYTGDPDFDTVWNQYQTYANRPSLTAEVVQLLKDYEFDKPNVVGNKSPLEQFEIAHKAFENPVTANNPVSTSLIPLRECLQSVIDRLLKRFPLQEKTKNERSKIQSIGAHLLLDNITKDVIDEWADEWDDINKGDLSGSKTKHVERDEWLAQLNRGTSFLHALLRGLDRNKFRK